jgi:transglutaminase-like putative cysteine protease
MRGFLSSIPDGDAGTYATVQAMRALARRDALDPTVRMATSATVQGVPFDRGAAHAGLIRRWIEPRVYFLADPLYAEALHAPAWQIRQILTRGVIGVDCDDVAMLAAAMGLSIGLKARYVLAGFGSPQAPFRHVWTELSAVQRPQWIAIDPTRPAQGLPATVSRRITVEV